MSSINRFLTISLPRARHVILHASGVHEASTFGRGIDAALEVLRHLAFIQIDTNYVVERTHHHVLWSRVPDYEVDWLQQLQAGQEIVEAWLYATGYMPMEQYRFSLPVKAAFVERRGELTPAETSLMRNIHNRIACEGPLRASDIENDRVGRSSGWWDWRPSKVALERMYREGSLLATRKKDFQKIFDIPENILVPGTDLNMPAPVEFARYMIFSGLRMFGLASAKDLASRARYVKGHRVKQELATLVGTGDVLAVQVENVEGMFYMLPEYAKKKIKLTGDAFILSPFDPLIVFRQRLKDFFNFDYMVECFVPAPKRKYGYFSLPVLIGNRFVARMDAKADRKKQILVVHNLHFEKVKLTTTELKKLRTVLQGFAEFNGCVEIQLFKTNKRDWVGRS